MNSATTHVIQEAGATPHEGAGVRKVLGSAALRIGYALGSRIAPEAVVRHATKLLLTPCGGSHRRALLADSVDAVHVRLWHGDCQLATYRWGDPSAEPYVLFVHGWSGFALFFSPWVKALRAQGYAVVGFDQPGHGLSGGRCCTLPTMVQALKVMATVHGPPAGLLAHSLGAYAATLALAAGMRAAPTVFIAPVFDLAAMVERFARTVALPSSILPRLVRALEYEAQTLHPAPVPHTPALIVHDLKDSEVPWSDGESFARYVPGARLLTTCGLGHRSIINTPSVINAGLRFMRGEIVGESVISDTKICPAD